jgi:Outer membrane lipoprotein-sorting protein
MCRDREPSMLALALALLASLAAGRAEQSPSGSLTADAVAKQAHDRSTGRDSRMAMRMKLFDRHGRVRERALTVTSLRGREAPGASPSAPDGDRLLIRFTYPNDIRGTSFLVWEHPKADDERFLYLPSLGRVRRIAGAETQESFVGSDFTYEDIGGRELDEYTYAFAGPDNGNGSWSPVPGAPAKAAWRLESRRKDQSAEFPRVVSLVLKDTFVVVAADVYNRRNEKQKTYAVRRLEPIEGIWTVMESEMADALEKTRTELGVETADYNVGLKEIDFSRRELERR